MGTIGVYDYDWFTHGHTLPNLECMKLCAYYRTHNEITVFTPKFDSNPYSRFILRKDYDDGQYSKICVPGIEYGGHAFSKDKYISLPEDIERTIPDTNIYEKHTAYVGISKESEALAKNFLCGYHLRLSLDGKTIWNDFDKAIQINPGKRIIYLHDYDLNQIKDAGDVIGDISHWVAASSGADCAHPVGTKFPIQIYNDADFEKWYNVFPNKSSFYIQFNGIASDEAIYDLKMNNQRISVLLNYNIAPAWLGEEHFFEVQLPEIYKQIVFLRSRYTRISLIFDDENVMIDERIKELLAFISEYTRHITQKNAMINFARSIGLYYGGYNREKARKIFQYVREKSYRTFDMFYQLADVKFEGGKLV